MHKHVDGHLPSSESSVRFLMKSSSHRNTLAFCCSSPLPSASLCPHSVYRTFLQSAHDLRSAACPPQGSDCSQEIAGRGTAGTAGVLREKFRQKRSCRKTPEGTGLSGKSLSFTYKRSVKILRDYSMHIQSSAKVCTPFHAFPKLQTLCVSNLLHFF